MTKTIKMAPDLEEIKRDGNVFYVEFNGMRIKWVLDYKPENIGISDEAALKKWLQTAIGMSGKTWQVPYLLNKHLPFGSEVYVNDEVIDYPKD